MGIMSDFLADLMVSETSAEDVYVATSFPNLLEKPSTCIPNQCKKLTTVWVDSFHGHPTIVKSIILAWAILLKEYTARDEVVFKVDGVAIAVNFDENKIAKVSKFEGHEGTFTAIFLEKTPAKDDYPSLYLQRTSDNALLLSADVHLVPSSHVQTISSQLMHIISSGPQEPRHIVPSYPSFLAPSILNPAPTLLQGPSRLHEFFVNSAEKFPEAIALEHLDSDGKTKHAYTYKQINQLSNEIRDRLLPFISDVDTNIIPVLIPQGPWLYISQLGILKAGGAFAPVNLDIPQERLKFICKDVQAKAAIVDVSLRSAFDWEGSPSIVTVNSLEYAKEVDASAQSHSDASPDSTKPAYVMYTSGSTGLPKGVLISHKAATQALIAHDKHIPPFERFLQFAAPTFDVSVYEIFFPFLRGKTLISADRGQMLGNLPGVINTMEADGAEFTPTVLGTLVTEKRKVPKLKVALTIGEMLTRRVVDEFGYPESEDEEPGLLQGMYGPTEAAIHCSVTPNFKRSYRTGDIGIPFDTVSAFIIGPPVEGRDPDVLPLGFAGELAVGGYQLADGYINRDELTKAAFIETRRFGRIYRTGDRARFLPDGHMECLGRISSGQVKLRGQRVELGEIEEITRKAPGVNGVVASVINGNLVVFVDGVNVNRSEVKDTCKKWLPSYMVPSDIVIMSQLPRLSSGKADRKGLEKEYAERVVEEVDNAEALDEIEKSISEAIAKILNSSATLSKSSSLAAAGLDSIRAIGLVTKLRDQGWEVPVVDVLKGDSIAAIAEVVRRQAGPIEETSPVILEAVKSISAKESARLSKMLSLDFTTDIQDVIPCTNVQEAMLAESHNDPTAYANWILLDLPLTYDDSRIENAVKSVINKNEILRTGFAQAADAGFLQVVWKTFQEEQFRLGKEVSQAFAFDIEKFSAKPPFLVTAIRESEKTTLQIHLHHALYDGWAWEQFLDDLEFALEGKEIQQRPQYREVVYHELGQPKESLATSIQFWSDYLAGMAPEKLPNLTGRVDIKPFVFSERLVFSASRQEVENLAKAQSVSPQVIIQAAWAFLLGSYLGSDDVVFGTVASGRTLPVRGIEKILGPTIRTLPIRVKLVGSNTTIASLLADINQSNRHLLEFGDLPLREVKKAAKIEGQDALFDSLIIWQQTLEETNKERVIGQIDSRDHLEYSVLLEIELGHEELSVKGTFQGQSIPSSQAKILLSQLDQVVLNLISLDISQNIGVENLLEFPTELLSIENQYPESPNISRLPTLHSFVEQSAMKTPDNIAVSFVNEFRNGELAQTDISFQELNVRANRVAHGLIKQGVKPGGVICVWMDKSIELYISILGILKTGSAYLPITADAPRARVITILETADVEVVLTTRELAEAAELPDSFRVLTNEDWDVSGEKTTNPRSKVYPTHAAYVLFTSGSTGTPKGVTVNHASTVSNITTLLDLFPKPKDGKLLQFCSQGFDVSVFEIFTTWAVGMTLCTGTRDVLLRDLTGIINELGITHLSLTNTVASLINPSDVPTVEFLIQIGEPVTEIVKKKWTAFENVQFVNGYGPTEATNIVTARWPVKPWTRIDNVGAPLRCVSGFVLAEDGGFTPVPRGAVGEVCYGGVQVARGYLKREDLTAKVFMEHPQYGRIYRTGDVGRLLPDGSFQLQGRRDNQIKIRGLRVELGEISAVITSSEHVSETSTLVFKRDDIESLQLVSFAAIKSSFDTKFKVLDESEIDPELISSLYKLCEELLPPYMVPSAIIPVSLLPMNAAGKVDNAVLRNAFSTLASAESYGNRNKSSGSSDWTMKKRKVAAIIAEVARVPVEAVDQFTSIFKLGIDSISSITLAKKLEQAGFIRPEVSQIMRNPDANSLSSVLIYTKGDEEVIKTHHVADFEAEVRKTVIETLPYAQEQLKKILTCTPLQQAMLSQSRQASADGYYNHTIYELRVDSSRLRWVWEQIAEKHEILKTCFCVTSSRNHPYAQVVLDSYPLAWTEVHLSSETEFNAAAEQRIKAISSDFNFAKPPYALTLFTWGSGSRLILSLHHSLYDGFALDLLFEDVASAYRGLEISERPAFDGFLEYLENQDLEKADDFWKDYLSGLEPVVFPDLTGLTQAGKEGLTGAAQIKGQSSVPLASIESFCKEQSISLLAFNQAVWARLLSCYIGQTDVCFGNVVGGRTVPVDGVESMIAPCFNTVPVRAVFTAQTSLVSVAQTIQKGNTDMMPFQMTPLRRIMKVMNTEGSHLFDTLFILQHDNEGNYEDLWKMLEDKGEMDFSVVLELLPQRKNNNINITLHCRRNVISEEHGKLLLQQFNACVQDFIENHERAVQDFSAVDRRILSIANADFKTEEENEDRLLHSLFEKFAKEQPHKVSLEFLTDKDEHIILTFAQLNQNANKLANFLLSLGVRRDEAVPICLEKSPEYYTAVLAVLKAGAAFTPIDPSAPEERKQLMLDELDARIVIASSATKEGLHSSYARRRIINIDVEDLRTQSVSNPHVENLTPSCLAYRLYTSGSTGKPKAVSLEISAALQTIRTSRNIIPWNDKSRLLQFAANTFDMCYYDCFMAWNYGFTLVSAGRNKLLGSLSETIKALGVTMLDLTPTVASTLKAEDLPGVELLYCIGEAMPQKLVNDWEGRCVNSYGPTEAAMCCTITPVNRNIKSLNVGKPFPTASFYVYSADGEQVQPVFGVGELCIGGPQLAREYFKNETLTESRFMQTSYGRLYRTGDNVRMLADGTFEFIGRTDDQIKIRGLRVELDEINVVLKESSEKIQDCVTLVLKHTSHDKDQLVSFIAMEPRKHHGLDPSALVDNCLVESARKYAEKKLPRYMIPGVMLVVDHIPLSAAGKVNRNALKALFNEQDIASFDAKKEEDGSAEKWSSAEQTAREVFATLSSVPVENIRHTSTIYQLGLDSISATQVSVELRKRGLEISVIDILQYPSIKELGDLLPRDENEVEEEENESVTVHPEEDDEVLSPYLSAFNVEHVDEIAREVGSEKNAIQKVLPCTPAQEGMLSQFLQSNGHLYFNHLAVELPSGVDVKKLEWAWRSAAEHHEMLRCGFVEIEDDKHSFAGIIYRRGVLRAPWFTIEINGTFEDQQKELEKTFAQEAFKKLSLPPWRVALVKERTRQICMFSAHHALYDGYSLSLILNDVSAFYRGDRPAVTTSSTNVLSEICRQAFDETTLEHAKEFWLQQLSGTVIHRFPSLTPNKINATTSHVLEHTSKWEYSRIESGARSIGFSVANIAQAAWARVLSAYSGEVEVTYGTVISGRFGIEDSENAVFPCVTTLPSLSKITGSNKDLVRRTQLANAMLLKYQHTPLKSIQRWFEHPDQSFFDSIFVFQKGEKREALWEKVVGETASVDYAISIEVEPREDNSLLLRATCRDDLLPIEQTNMMLAQLDAAIIDIVSNPDLPCNEYTLFPDNLLAKLPANTPKIPTDIELLHEFIPKFRRIHPNKPAYEFATSIREDGVEKVQWSYAQLDDIGNQIANYLRDKVGVRTGDIVGISFEKCPEATFALVGILKAGAAFVALDYSAPIDRKEFITKDSQAKCILTMPKYVKELASKVDVPVIAIEGSKDIERCSTKQPILEDLTPEHVCYCLYTSGTTGTPKGCLITHSNAVQAMLAFQRLFAGHWNENSRFLQFASFHFDVSVLEQFWSWTVGICVTSAPRDLIFEDLVLTIKKLEITHLDLTPSLAALLQPDELPLLKKGVFITGGEALKQEVLDAWGKFGCLYNGYGPTEVTIGCTMYPRVPADGKPSNIGPQFDNVGSYVLTPKTFQPVLKGALGELCVSGMLVGKGYLNRDDLTSERFPYVPEFGEKIYRTGDYVRLLHNGCFDFGGRTDDQVKLRGQRLEIGEINEVLKNSDPVVQAVATLVLKHPKQQKDQLVSFFTSTTFSSKEAKVEIVSDKARNAQLVQKLITAAKRKLPVYMVPTHFIPLTKIPLSVNNKVDNKALAALYSDASLDLLHLLGKSAPAANTDWNKTERQVRDIVAQVTKLSIEDVQKHSTIFELGLDSVSVVGLAKRLRKNGFDNASVSVIMKHPSVEQLASALIGATNDCSSLTRRLDSVRNRFRAFEAKARFHILSQLNLKFPEEIESILPCTALQEGMIARFLNSYEPLYYNSFTLILENHIDVRRLQQAWEEIVRGTSVLRTAFCETPDGYAQVSLKSASGRWSEERPITENLEDIIAARLQAESSNDLRVPPVFALLIKLPLRNVLVINAFHALYDGASMGLILDDLRAAYLGKYKQRPLQFNEVVPMIHSLDNTAAEAFWKEALNEIKPASFPVLTRTPVTDDISIERTLSVSPKDLESFCKSLGCTTQAVLQAAWAFVLKPHIGPSPSFGVIVSGRALPLDNVEDVVGPMFNTVPFKVDIQESSTWKELVQSIQTHNSECIAFHHTPLRLISKWTKCKNLFDTLFVYQQTEERHEEEKLWEIGEDHSKADYPLAIEVENNEKLLKVTIKGKGEYVDIDVCNSLAENLQKALGAILKNPEGRVSNQVSQLSGGEKSPAKRDSEPSTVSAPDFSWTAEAKAIRNIIATLSEVEETEINENTSILEVGLDSIEAIKLSSRLKATGILLSVSTIMRNPTIKQMHAALASSSSKPEGESKETDILAEFEQTARSKLKGQINMDNVKAIYPTTPLQEGMIAETLASDYSLYYNHDVLKVGKNISIKELRRAIEEVVAGEDILRTIFFNAREAGMTGPSEFGQVVLKTAPLQWSHKDVTDGRQLEDVIHEAFDESRRSVDMLSKVPLSFKHLTVRDANYVVLSIHHALYDGWSLDLLHQAIERAYDGKYTPGLSYATLLKNILSSNKPAAETFWKQYLSGSTPASFPVLLDTPSPDSPTVHRLSKKSAANFYDTQSFCRRHGISPLALGQTCWSLVLANYLQQPDVLFGTVLSGRDDEQSERMMFPSMNTVIVRTIAHGTYKELLQYVQDNCAHMLRWQFMPLRKVQSMLEEERKGRRLFDTLFIFQRGQEPNEEGIWKSVQGASDVEYNVCVEFERSGNDIIWNTAVKSNIMSAKQAQSLLDQLDSLLLDILQDAEREAIVFESDSLVIGNLPSTNDRESKIVKIGSHHVNLSFVSETVSSFYGHNRVAHSIVATLKGEPTLVTVVAGGQIEITDTLKEYLDEKLPEWMIPKYIVSMKSLPAPGGVGDDKALQDKIAKMSADELTAYSFINIEVDEDSGEWTPTELIVRRVLSSVSGIAECEVERSHTVFHLGLDSISAIRVSSELRKNGIQLGVAAILKEASVKKIAAMADRKNSGGKVDEETVIDVETVIKRGLEGIDLFDILESAGLKEKDVQELIPATGGQVYMVSCWQNSNGVLYMPTFTYKTPGPLEEDRFREAYKALLEENTMLRTVLLATDSEEVPLIQAVMTVPKVQLSWEDVEEDFIDSDYLKSRISFEQSKRPNAKLPLVRATVLTSERESYVLLTVHHALYDGLSLPLLFSRLQELYDNHSSKPPTDSLAVMKSFVAHSLAQSSSNGLSYWKSQLAGVASTFAPALHPEAPTSSRTEFYRPGALSSVSSLELLSRSQGVNVQSILLASLAKSLAPLISQSLPPTPAFTPASSPAPRSPSGDMPNIHDRDLVLNMYFSNRSSPVKDILNAPIPVLNVVPLRIRAPGMTSIVDLARQIQDDLRVISSEGATVGADAIRRATGCGSDISVNFLFGLDGGESEERDWQFVNYESVGDVPRPKPKWAPEAAPLAKQSGRKYVQTNLDVEIAIRHGKLDIGLFAPAKVVSEDDIAQVVDGMVEELRSL